MGGEGDAVGDQDDREISFATWADNSELNPRGIAHYHLSVDTSAIIAPSVFGNVLWISSKINVYSVWIFKL